MRVEQDVLAVLSAADITSNAVTLAGQLDRKLYERTNKVLEAAGGKWNRKTRSHVFDSDATDAIEQILLTGEIISAKQEFGFFPTPLAIVNRILDLADIRPGMEVLEPSAGIGSIAKEVPPRGAHVDCVEILPRNVGELIEAGYMRSIIPGDFLAMAPRREYDRVVMNPPFAKQADIHHVNHAAKFLKPGGRLVAVMSACVRFRENRLTSEFRALIENLGGSIEDVPEGAFRESGTMVRTVIVTLNDADQPTGA